MDQTTNHDVALLAQQFQALIGFPPLEQVLEMRDTAEAFRMLAQSAKKGLEVQNEYAVYRLKAERKAGEILTLMHRNGAKKFVNSHGESVSLEDMHIDHNESSRWQQLARIPERVFQAYINDCKIHEKEVTDRGLKRFGSAANRLSRKARKHNVGLSKIAASLKKLVNEGRKFGCICVNTPWPDSSRVGSSYRQDEIDEPWHEVIAKFPMADLAATDCHLHLWSSNDRLRDSMKLLTSWKFKYRSVLDYEILPPHNSPFWRPTKEFVVLGTKGSMTFRSTRLLSSIERCGQGIEEMREEAYIRILQASPAPYLELFGKGSRNDWIVLCKDGRIHGLESEMASPLFARH